MKTTVDYIVVGGGSGGCVMASRLSEDPNTTVALLEAGGDGTSPFITIPSGAVAMLPTKLHNWAFETVPQPGLNGRRGYQPRGKTLGGSSATNAMVYIRGHRTDYDRWAFKEGCEGWSYNEVLPYFKLSEGNGRINNEYHGTQGPLSVNDLRSDNPFQNLYVKAAEQVGYKITDDFNGADQEGVGIYQVTQRHGERCSAARAYIHPHMTTRPNLHVHLHSMAQRIVFEGKKAVAVEFTKDGQTHRIEARKEIILTAGALQTPQLLMVSGVGDGAELQKHGIALVHHLPGVGKNLHDHPDFIFGYEAKSTDLLGISLRGSLRVLREIFRFRRERRGMLTSNFAEGGGFLKTSPDLEAPNVQLHFVVALVDDHARTFHPQHGMSCHVCLLRPRSRGTLTLQGRSMDQAPLIDPAFFADPQDLEDMVAGFKMTRKLMQAPALAQYITKDKFTAGVETDDQIREVLRKRTDTVYHPVGTCKMGTDPLSVVNPSLQVHGLQNLRIVDGSVIPSLIGGNTNAPIIMMAEKAVDIIRGHSRVGEVQQVVTTEKTQHAEITA